MTAKISSTEWRIIGETVPGASHLRAGIPNQDAILQLRESSRALPLVLAVSDGHGSPKCFRSHLGSRFAVKKSASLVSEFLDERRGNFDVKEIEAEGKTFLPPEFVRRWREAVETHLEKNPFTDEEFKKLEEKSGAEARQLVEKNPFLAYGATSLTVAVEENFILYLQLGDGDILLVSEKGEVTRALPEDERLFANETTSLCLPHAENDFRFFVQEISAENAPALVMLSSDGYVNSFSEEAGFLKAGGDFLELLGTEGYDYISENLKTWLEETTATGSGDDTTVGIIYRPEAVKSAAPDELEITASEVTAASSAPTDADAGKNFPLSPENMEDVTVTITIKKDKNKPPIDAPPKIDAEKSESKTS
jgi:serine/threonine protein phosphatase PrpC